MDFKLKKSNLNFRVYTSEAEPTAPGVENDIVIITSVPMPNWILSPDKPTGAPRSDGDVWIRYSVKGNAFNALKQGSMMIATISAWQYVNGAWCDVTAKSCQSGEWVDWWNGALYDNGKQIVPWIEKKKAGNWSGRTVSFENSHVYLPGGSSSSDNSIAGIITENKIDISRFTTLVVDFEDMVNVSSNESITVQLTSVQNDSWEHSNAIAYKTLSSNVSTITVEFNATGSYYIEIFGMRRASAKVKRVELL